MQSITGNILIDFQNLPGSEEEIQYHKQVYGAIKLQLNQMERYQKTDRFNHCQNCQMVLTVQDRNAVYDWQQICSNQQQFSDVIQKCKEDQDRLVWICSFCQKKNIIDSKNIKFAKNNSRVVHKQGQIQGNKKQPILLIVFDISGSMQEVVLSDTSAYSNLLAKIKKTKIYQKIVAEQQKQISIILQKQNIKVQANDHKNQYQDFLKKNKLLMGITQALIGQIESGATQRPERQGKFNSSKAQKVQKSSKNIGFIFFHSNVIIQNTNIDPDVRAVVVCDTKDGYGSNTGNMHRQRVNFDDFDNLFKLGASYGGQYNTKINEFQFNNLQCRSSDSVHGQSALGPALVIGLGVVSRHGPGSSLVVVSDGMGNKGIFDQSEKWQNQIKQLKQKLQKQKCFLTMLQCRDGQGKQKQVTKTVIDEFCLKNDTVARKINIILDKNKNADSILQDVKNKMRASINRQNAIWTSKVIIRSQNPCINFDDSMKNLTNKLHNTLQNATYIKPKIDYKKLEAKHYLHYFVNQAVIKYENTQTGQQSTFMTYILQKIIKYDSLKRQTIRKLDNEQTFHQMLQYLSAQQQNYDISNIPLSFVKKTFRDTLLFSKSICNRSMRFSGKSINSQRKEQQVSFFADLHKRGINQVPEEIYQQFDDMYAL